MDKKPHEEKPEHGGCPGIHENEKHDPYRERPLSPVRLVEEAGLVHPFAARLEAVPAEALHNLEREKEPQQREPSAGTKYCCETAYDFTTQNPGYLRIALKQTVNPNGPPDPTTYYGWMKLLRTIVREYYSHEHCNYPATNFVCYYLNRETRSDLFIDYPTIGSLLYYPSASRPTICLNRLGTYPYQPWRCVTPAHRHYTEGAGTVFEWTGMLGLFYGDKAKGKGISGTYAGHEYEVSRAE